MFQQLRRSVPILYSSMPFLVSTEEVMVNLQGSQGVLLVQLLLHVMYNLLFLC